MAVKHMSFNMIRDRHIQTVSLSDIEYEFASDENIADFYPIIEIMRKDIYDELPQYTKLFIQSKVGVLLNKPHLALTGKCRP